MARFSSQRMTNLASSHNPSTPLKPWSGGSVNSNHRSNAAQPSEKKTPFLFNVHKDAAVAAPILLPIDRFAHFSEAIF